MRRRLGMDWLNASWTANGANVLEVRGIVKRFGPVVALDGVDLDLRRGEILGLVGDNGAGKSTLSRIIGGAVLPTEGEIWLDGEQVVFDTPGAARRLGIETVHQHLALIDGLSVTANLFAGREPRNRFGLLDRSLMNRMARDALERLRVRVPDVRSDVRTLSGGQRQAVAVARAVMFGSRVVILDEPTSALSGAVTEQVFEVVRGLAASGIAVIFIGHSLERVRMMSDRIVVLRRGRVVGRLLRSEATTKAILELILGSDQDRDASFFGAHDAPS